MTDVMTAQEQQATGYLRLTAVERAALDRWLNSYTATVISVTTGQPRVSAPATPAPSENAISSRIDGEFEGWDGDTIVRLSNGQIWKQTEYHYEYHYAYGAEVTVYRSGSGWKMQVDGLSKAVRVERLR